MHTDWEGRTPEGREGLRIQEDGPMVPLVEDGDLELRAGGDFRLLWRETQESETGMWQCRR